MVGVTGHACHGKRHKQQSTYIHGHPYASTAVPQYRGTCVVSHTSQSPIKVYPATKERLRHAAGLLGCTQAELLDRAVDEYLATHHAEFSDRLDAARSALLGDEHEAVAFALGVEREAIDAVAAPVQRT